MKRCLCGLSATPATGVVLPSIAYAQSYKPWPYDPVKARELLKEAGYPNGFSNTLWSSHNHTAPRRKCCNLPSSS
ncbi:ABC transporter substrate-binding protein [Escherichia coli]|nr:ABC transporter substrate-binding protein [Escherichia coli]